MTLSKSYSIMCNVLSKLESFLLLGSFLDYLHEGEIGSISENVVRKKKCKRTMLDRFTYR
jgi:hypothetical protein